MLRDLRWKDVEIEPNPVRDLLLKAADLIEQRGLAKYALEDPAGRLCINGALIVARFGGHADSFTADMAWHDDLVKNAAFAMSNAVPHSHYSGGPWAAAYWNNMPERTKEEVVNALRETAALVKSSET